jgi:hypothetical protein
MFDRYDIVVTHGSLIWRTACWRPGRDDGMSWAPLRSWPLRMVCGLLSLILALGEQEALGGDSTSSRPGTVAGQGEIWRSNHLCGQNCLYVMLRMMGIRTDYSRVTESLSDQLADISLTDLERIGRRNGLGCVMGRGDRRALEELPKPVITHFEPDRPDTEMSGHYVLVLRSDQDRVVFLDGTTAVIEEMPWRDFLRRWSGYMIYVPETRWGMSSAVALAAACCGLFLGSLVNQRLLGRFIR